MKLISPKYVDIRFINCYIILTHTFNNSECSPYLTLNLKSGSQKHKKIRIFKIKLEILLTAFLTFFSL